MAAADPRIAIIGVHIKSDAYPNVKYKVDGLLGLPGAGAREWNFPPGATRRFASRQTGLAAKAAAALGFALAHLRALGAIVRHARRSALYVPYPAVFVLFLLSLLPRRLRPPTVHADAFISLYDTIVNDRALLGPGHPLARLLRRIERRAYRAADAVWVDTPMNSIHMAALFGLPPERFAALPLSINETVYAAADYLPPTAGPCTVLFIGTFVPLQGVDVIADAILLLRAEPGLRFRIIGDGQTAGKVAAILAAGGANLTWERGWQSAGALAAEIAAADICLGIFGGGDKAQRVWPFKNYGYMAVGRALISAQSPAEQALAAAEDEAAWVAVPAQRPDLLAAEIVALAHDPRRRSRLAQAAARYYQRHLSNTSSIGILARRLGVRAGQQ